MALEEQKVEIAIKLSDPIQEDSTKIANHTLRVLKYSLKHQLKVYASPTSIEMRRLVLIKIKNLISTL